MKTKLKSLSERALNIFILILALLLIDCSGAKKICSKKELNSKCGCNPYYERAYKMTLSLDKASSKEVKKCIDKVGLNGTVLDVEYANLSLNGCISSSKKIDTLFIQSMIKAWESIPWPKYEYEKWCECKYNGGQQTKRGIIMMDSHIKGVVYCERTQNFGGSNADDILKLLNYSKVVPYTVSTNIQWMDEQRVIDLSRKIIEESKKPALIIIHASAFYEKTQEFEGNTKLLLFLESLKNENVKILVYTRGLPEESGPEITQRFDNVIGKVEELKDKAYLLVIDPQQNPCFDNPEVGMAFRNKIRKILNE